MFSIYDSKAQAYIAPWISPNLQTGFRIFQQAALDESTIFAKNPGDFSLMYIGTFDQEKGDIKPLNPKVDLGTARMAKAEALAELRMEQPTGPFKSIPEYSKPGVTSGKKKKSARKKGKKR